jgi:hypothetical protein
VSLIKKLLLSFTVAIASVFLIATWSTQQTLQAPVTAPVAADEAKTNRPRQISGRADEQTQQQVLEVTTAASAAAPVAEDRAVENLAKLFEKIESQMDDHERPSDLPYLDDILDCRFADQAASQRIASNMPMLIKLGVLDTPEARESMAYVMRLSGEVCARFGTQRALALLRDMRKARNSHVALTKTLEDLVTAGANISPTGNGTGARANMATVQKILYRHDSPTAVEFALAKLFEERRSVQSMPFFNAGTSLPDLGRRLMLLPSVGAMYGCKLEPSSCLPGGYRTLLACSSAFTCASDRDYRYQIESRHSSRQMQAIDAMVAALHDERVRQRGKP